VADGAGSDQSQAQRPRPVGVQPGQCHAEQSQPDEPEALTDRPGLGWSDWQSRRRVLDWPLDVTALADALGLQRFAVLGYSSGAPFRRATLDQALERRPQSPVGSSFRTASAR
jgi:hypothetical protein